jgi:hypothetical protein
MCAGMAPANTSTNAPVDTWRQRLIRESEPTPISAIASKSQSSSNYFITFYTSLVLRMLTLRTNPPLRLTMGHP